MNGEKKAQTNKQARKTENTLTLTTRNDSVVLLLSEERRLPGVSLHFSLSIIMQEPCEEFSFCLEPEALKPQNINGLGVD